MTTQIQEQVIDLRNTVEKQAAHIEEMEIELARLQRIEQAALNIQERLDNHFGGGEHSDDWKEQTELRAALEVTK